MGAQNGQEGCQSSPASEKGAGSDLGELLAADAAAVAEDGTTALGGHAGTESMLAHAADLRRLVLALHKKIERVP